MSGRLRLGRGDREAGHGVASLGRGEMPPSTSCVTLGDGPNHSVSLFPPLLKELSSS